MNWIPDFFFLLHNQEIVGKLCMPVFRRLLILSNYLQWSIYGRNDFIMKKKYDLEQPSWKFQWNYYKFEFFLFISCSEEIKVLSDQRENWGFWLLWRIGRIWSLFFHFCRSYSDLLRFSGRRRFWKLLKPYPKVQTIAMSTPADFLASLFLTSPNP